MMAWLLGILSEGFVLYLQNLEEEVTRLQAANSDLLKDKQEALPLLEAYRSAQANLLLMDVIYRI